MTQTMTEASLTNDGVAFAVRVDSVKRDCIISLDALAKLSKLKNGDSDPMSIYRAYEASINGVARRLVAANVQGTPLMVGPQFFN